MSQAFMCLFFHFEACRIFQLSLLATRHSHLALGTCACLAGPDLPGPSVQPGHQEGGVCATRECVTQSVRHAQKSVSGGWVILGLLHRKVPSIAPLQIKTWGSPSGPEMETTTQHRAWRWALGRSAPHFCRLPWPTSYKDPKYLPMPFSNGLLSGYKEGCHDRAAGSYVNYA